MTLSFLYAYLFSKRSQGHIKKMARISLVGIFLGSFSLMVVLSIMAGLNLQTEERLLKHEPHLVISKPNEAESLNLTKVLKEMSWKNEVVKAHDFELQDVLIRTDEGYFNGAEALGLSKASVKSKKSFKDHYDEPLIYEFKNFEGGEEVLIGPDLAYELKIVEGDVIELYKPETILTSQTQLGKSQIKSVTVTGILNTDGGDREGRLIVYSLGALFPKSALSKTRGKELYFKEANDASAYKADVVKAGFKAETWKDRNSSLFMALKIEKLAITFLLGIALLVTSFSIMTLLILIIVQKQKDIGILLSMGLSVKKVRLLFGGIGGSLAIIGVLTGLGFGMVVSILLDLYPIKILPPIYQDPYLPADFNLQTSLWVLFFCISVAVLSSIVPVLYLSKVNPVSALKGLPPDRLKS